MPFQGAAAATMHKKNKAISIVLSYHRYDIEWVDSFLEQVKPFQDAGQLALTINEVSKSFQNLEVSSPLDILILCISNKYLSLNNLVERIIPVNISILRVGTHIIPVYLEDCPWQSISWLREIKLWPSHQLPFSNMSDRERENHISRFIKDELKLSGSEEDRSAYREGKSKDGTIFMPE